MFTLRDNEKDHNTEARPRVHGQLHDEDRMGLILLGVAFLAFATYTAFFFAGFLHPIA